MNPQAPPLKCGSVACGCVVLTAAALIALGSAHDYAGGWNDGSRLATAEALVDYHTWSIDQSIFVRPSTVAGGAPTPYTPGDYALNHSGTQDKLFINGLYYSDKSPVPSLWLAAVYAGLQFFTGWTARANADAFCTVSGTASGVKVVNDKTASSWARLCSGIGFSQASAVRSAPSLASASCVRGNATCCRAPLAED